VNGVGNSRRVNGWSVIDFLGEPPLDGRNTGRREQVYFLEHCGHPALDLCGERHRRTPRLRLLESGIPLLRAGGAKKTRLPLLAIHQCASLSTSDIEHNSRLPTDVGALLCYDPVIAGSH
jgi:hypothetical protein